MARGKCNLTVNGKVIRANVGETLIDAALGGRIVMPHDCCSGQCETCRVTVVSGDVDDFGTREKNTVLGCLATLEGDAEVTYEPVPVVRNTKGNVESIQPITDDLLEVRVRMSKPVPWLPGQYVRLAFKGFPQRDYSPTIPFDLEAEHDVLVFHVKVYPQGRLSSQFGRQIDIGHKVVVKGPYGNCYLRRQSEPMILVSTGTGFAPIWAIAVAASIGQPNRQVHVIAGARKKTGLYMEGVADWLRERGVTVTLTAGDGDGFYITRKRPADCLPTLSRDHVVYAAGSPSQVDAVRHHALAADATFYADPFFAASTQRTFREWAELAFRGRRSTEPATAAA